MLLLTGRQHLWLMPASLLAGFLWQAWPHPVESRFLLPDAILLACLYWTLRRPHNMTPQLGLLIGLFKDALYGSILGQHALSTVITLYIMQLLSQQIRLFTLWQQSMVIGLLSVLYLLSGHWIQLLASPGYSSGQFLLPALATGLCWPPTYLLLQMLERNPVPRAG